MKKIFLLLVVITSLCACKKENSSSLNPEEKIYQDLLVRYNLYDNTMDAMATFRKKDKEGVRLELTGNAEINFNGWNYTSFLTAIHYFYTWNLSKTEENGTFKFVKNKKETFINTISKSDIVPIAIPSSLKIIKLDGTSILAWTGKALTEGETISIYLEQGKNSSGQGNIYQEGAKQIAINKVILGDLKAGKATIYLSRSTKIGYLEHTDGAQNGIKTVESVVAKEIILK